MPKVWSERGRLHRLDGPAIVDLNSEAWYKRGHRHRDGGPALVFYNSHEVWFRCGKVHRIDGPAIIYYHYSDMNKWVVNDLIVKTVTDFCRYSGVSEEAALLLVLKYGGLTV